ncbi:YmfQ family protein [Xanthomonas albilineans]|uniref:YmfQ family protein n=1 Tax=Xanthomonas albilineans TaxID=29447 RepID=UPI0006983EDE|nr:putative phage tail protein [Xanthomonas albilineans]
MAVMQQISQPLTAVDYLASLQKLLPYGPAWTDDPDAAITRLLTGLAQELARCDASSWQLIEEADPRTTDALFPDWERVAGLPDLCVTSLSGQQTLAQRRTALVSRLTQIGGQSRAYFVAVARTLGSTITITEGWQAIDTVISPVNNPLTNGRWVYTWTIHAPLGDTRRTLTVNGRVCDPLATWRNTLLECVMRRLKPAHTTLLFSYT